MQNNQTYQNNAFSQDIAVSPKPQTALAVQTKPKPEKRKVQFQTVDMLSNDDYKKYRKEGRKGYAATINALLNLVVVMSLLGAFVYYQTIQAQLNYEYETLSSQLNILTSENVRLQVKLESELSNDAVEELARDIGMEELSNSNIEYISFNPTAKAEVLQNGNLFEKVVDWCEGVVLKLQF